VTESDRLMPHCEHCGAPPIKETVKWRQRAQKAEAETSAAREDHIQAINKILLLEAELVEMRDNVKLLGEQIVIYDGENDQRKAELAEAKRECKFFEEWLESAWDGWEKTEAELAEAQQRLKHYRDGIGNAIGDDRQCRDTGEPSLSDAKEIRRIKAELAGWKADAKEFDRQADAFYEEIGCLRAERDYYKAQAEELLGKLEKAEAETSAAREDHIQAINKILLLEAELATLRRILLLPT